MQVVIEILFIFLSNTNIKIIKLSKLTQRSYSTIEILLISGWIEFIIKKKFTKTAMDENSEIFMIYVSTLKVLTMISIYFSRIS